MDEGKGLQSFTKLSVVKRKAVQMRADGHSYREIAAELSTGQNAQFSAGAVCQWFTTGKNPLAPIVVEYSEYLGNKALAESVALVKVYGAEGLEILRELGKNPKSPGHVRVAAARVLAQPLIKAAYAAPLVILNPDEQREQETLKRMLDEDSAEVERMKKEML